MAARLLRLTAAVLAAAGFATIAWAIVVWRWQDPFTAVYTGWKQRGLTSAYQRKVEAIRARPVPRRADLAPVARRYRLASRRGEPIARIVVPRLGLKIIVVEGTDSATLCGREELALQACWPRFSATHRYIAYARPVRVVLGAAAGSRETQTLFTGSSAPERTVRP